MELAQNRFPSTRAVREKGDTQIYNIAVTQKIFPSLVRYHGIGNTEIRSRVRYHALPPMGLCAGW